MAVKNSGINLLPPEMRETGKLRAIRKFIRRGSFLVLAVYILGIVSLFVAYFFFFRKAGQLSTANSSLKAGVESFRENEVNLVILKDRLSLAKGVFARGAAAPEKLVDDVLAILPSSGQIVEIKAQEGKVTFDGIVPTSSDLSALFKALEESPFKEVTLKSLSLNTGSGGYSFSVQIR